MARFTLVLLPLVLLAAVACDSSADGEPAVDVVTPVDVVTGDAANDTGALCEEGEWSCSEDAVTLTLCVEGAWQDTDCSAVHQVCQDGACVPRAMWGHPAWDTCDEVEGATTETLAEKAAGYDEVLARLHIHPQLQWVTPVDLPRVEVACEDPDADEPCYGDELAVSLDDATWEDVAEFHHGENDGLWSAMVLASQAFRYAVTGSEDCLDIIRVLLAGEVTRMAVTGVPGLFTREFVPAGIDGISCTDDESKYVTDVEKDDNRWVQIRDDGCAWVIPNETMEWTKTDHCGLDDYAGWCFLDNVSQDEYAGHMLALGALLLLVDDDEVQATVRDLLGQVGRHLMENDLTFVDWDGRVTEHGKIYPMAFVNSPGYLATQSMNWILLAATATDDPELWTYYNECLMQRVEEPVSCFDYPMMEAIPFTDHLDLMLLYFDGTGPGLEGCLSNWNNFSMMMCNFHTLLWLEQEPVAAAAIQEAFDTQVMRMDTRIPLIDQKNPWYNFVWAAVKPLGPDTDGPAYDAVRDGICSLRQFPPTQAHQAQDNTVDYEHYCDSRLDRSLAEDVIPVHEQCTATYLFWKSPYQRRTCSAEPWKIEPPGDYLLPYWMGRYYGFITEDM